MLTAAQWIVWGITAFFAVGSLHYFCRAYSGRVGNLGTTIRTAESTGGTALAQLVMVLWMLFLPKMNKFHLLWLVPLSYPVGMFFGTFFMQFRLPKSFPIYATVGIFVGILYVLTP
jgi:hypothetical protein